MGDFIGFPLIPMSKELLDLPSLHGLITSQMEEKYAKTFDALVDKGDTLPHEAPQEFDFPMYVERPETT